MKSDMVEEGLGVDIVFSDEGMLIESKMVDEG